MIKALSRTPELTLEDKLTHLTDTLYRMDIDSKPPRNPLSPLLPLPVEGLEEALIKEEVEKEDGLVQFGQSDRRNRFTSNKGRFRPRQPFEKFDKSPNNKRPRVLGKAISKDKVRCFKCREFGHYRDECPVDDKPKQDDTNNPKGLEDYTYTIQAQTYSPSCK